MEDEFYIHDRTRGFIGNALVWWAKDHKGYTENIANAHVFKRSELSDLADNLRAYPKELVDQNLTSVVLDGTIDRDHAIQMPLAALDKE